MYRLFSAAFIGLVTALSCPAVADEGDAPIDGALGLAALAEGDTARAEALFSSACLADDGEVGACLEWGKLAEAAGNTSKRKQAYAAAVMLAPFDPIPKFRLGLLLLQLEDYAFAEGYLAESLALFRNARNRALVSYYLGFVALKKGEPDKASAYLEAGARFPEPWISARCRFFIAQIHANEGRMFQALSAFRNAAASGDADIRKAADTAAESLSAFPAAGGIGGRLSASLGFNSHPSSAFLDDVETDEAWVMQSIFRGDLSLRQHLGETGLSEALTVYREQNWLRFDNAASQDDDGASYIPTSHMTPQDMNLTLFALQLSVERRLLGRHFEHSLKLGADGEAQLLDSLPKKTSQGTYDPSGFGVHTWAAGGKIWWSFAARPESVYSLRFKVELRPNYVDEDRSSVRYRLRFVNNRDLLHRRIHIESIVGIRFDRTYRNPSIIQYDRLLPEFDIETTWHTPLSRWSLLLDLNCKLNWYLNSKYDAQNSFRYTWQDDPAMSESDNNAAEAAYYNAFTRFDPEVGVRFESDVDLWKKGLIALSYEFHARFSNIDNDTFPAHFAYLGDPPEYGYKQHILILELRQRF